MAWLTHVRRDWFINTHDVTSNGWFKRDRTHLYLARLVLSATWWTHTHTRCARLTAALCVTGLIYTWHDSLIGDVMDSYALTLCASNCCCMSDMTDSHVTWLVQVRRDVFINTHAVPVQLTLQSMSQFPQWKVSEQRHKSVNDLCCSMLYCNAVF